ncbi:MULTISPECIES: ABC-three component system protein [unclassified Rhizobium]|uniref:ABC-three component system protein n=1 Tax=unclassified Rhizobium TaxID=2613769 RepID=UPI001AE7B583|nr:MULTISPECIES: ABC-three component system protein [unclassified Rhizobium]MBP2463941.1 hypothetical protein [Rhizobium sp. PvP014]MBP2532307.1 hypothetical protein [Rhizobium sp. PvP099]
MRKAILGPADIIDGASVQGSRGVYVIGCFDQRITFYSQQVRALALIHALADQEYLKDGPRIAVIGGGAAGTAAAAAAALASSGQVVLFEEAQDLLKLQNGTDKRKLDPHIYNWPGSNAADPIADLPILDWEAGPSREVRDDVLRQFEDIAGRTGNRLTKQMRHRVIGVRAVGTGYELTIHEVDTGIERTERFEMLFLAFGFGLEPTESILGINDRSYWADAGVPGTEFQGRPNPHYFISGNGDGGLIDLVAAASANFDHGAMIRTVTAHPGLVEVEKELLAIERQARNARAAGGDIDLYGAYDARLSGLIEANGLVVDIGRQLRPGVQITLQTRGPAVFSLDTSMLNRFAVFATIKACETTAGRAFSHRACHTVARVAGYVPAVDQAPYQLDCDGELLAFDEVIIRRGTHRALVREPFANILGDYEAQHRTWLMRLGDATLVPTLSSDAQDFFRNLSREAHIVGSRRRIQLAQAAMPVAIHISSDGTQLLWAGDRTPEQIIGAWSGEGSFHITLANGPDELAAVAGAILRLAAHASQIKVYADPLVWSEQWRRLTAKSLHATGIPMPQVIGGNPGGAAQVREATGATRLASIVHRRLDSWMLGKIDEHLHDFFMSEEDPGAAIGLEIGADLRDLMRDTWRVWREALEDDPSLLSRFLRLMVSATDEEGDAVQVLVGPRKLSPIICGTALSLAVASVWGVTSPRGVRPGNLLRQIAHVERTGHGCSADRILGKRTSVSAQTHDWKTNFVLLALEGTLDVAVQAEMTFANIETRQPSLVETTGSGPIMMWITEPLIEALSQGVDALSAFLADVERRHEVQLIGAIERQGEPA